MREIIRRGGAAGSDENLNAEEMAAVQSILDFAKNRRLQSAVQGTQRDLNKLLFPQFCFDVANQWRGNHPYPLDYEDLDERAKTAVSCFDKVQEKREPGDKVSLNSLDILKFNFIL